MEVVHIVFFEKSYSACLENSNILKIWPFFDKFFALLLVCFCEGIEKISTFGCLKVQTKKLPLFTTRHSMIGSPERVKIQRS